MGGFVAFGGARRTSRHEETPQALASAWSPLRRQVFLALWIAALASNLGTWMQNVGAAWLMTSLASSPLMVSLIQTAASLPIFFLALPAGALADIVDRRKLLIFSQAWMLIAAGVLGALTLLGLTTSWVLLALSFLLGVGSALNAPAWQAIIPELVPREELAPAVTLNGINFNLARAAGPALGGLVVAWIGAGANFLLNAASFLGVMIVLYEWRRNPRPAVLPAERVMGAIRAGVRFTRHAPVLRAVLVRTAAFVIGASTIWAMLPLVARWQLGLGPAGFGVLLAWFGTGAAIGGAILNRLEQIAAQDRIIHASTLAFIAATAGIPFTHNPIVAGVLLAIAGGAWVAVFSLLNVTAQLSVPQWVQGRALAMYQIVVQGGMAVASAIWGVVGERYGISAALWCGAGALTIGLATWRWRIPNATQLSAEPSRHWPTPATAMDINPESGPALVMIEYRIDPARAPEFVNAMEQMRAIRLRDNAVFWGLFFDVNAPERFFEYFVTETWIEHLRQHERMLESDVVYEARVRSFNRGADGPAITHLVSAQTVMHPDPPPAHAPTLDPKKKDRT